MSNNHKPLTRQSFLKKNKNRPVVNVQINFFEIKNKVLFILALLFFLLLRSIFQYRILY